jgi:hypothetical protein
LDFNPEDPKKVPLIPYDENLILLTKKGRFSTEVVGYDYEPKIVEERGDWILWYFESKSEAERENLGEEA